MELYKVFVKEEAKVSHSYTAAKILPETKFKIYDSLEKQEDYYLMYEYTRNGAILQIGVKEAKATSVIVKMEGIEIALQRSVQKPDFWYEASVGWQDGFFFTRQEAIFGKNAAGIAEVKSFDENNKLMDAKKVLILPRTFSYEQYEMMKMDVKYYLENIASPIMSNNLESTLKGVDIPLYSLVKIESFMERLVLSLQKIIENPAEILIEQKKKVAQTKIRKWTSQLLIERELKGPNKKLSVHQMEKNTRLDEHRMIKGILDDVQYLFVQLKLVELGLLNQFKHEKVIREEKIKVASEHIIPMRNRIRLIEQNIQVLEKRHDQWLALQKNIEDMLKHELFMVEAKSFHMTHHFQYNPQYRKVVQLYEEWKSLVPKLEKMHRSFIKNVLSSPKLYQLWVLIQLIKEIEKYGYQPSENLWNSLLNHYQQYKEIDNWKALFESENGSKILLGYEVKTQKADGKQLQPDYLIAFRKYGEKQWALHVLDAKYKPYSMIDHGHNILKHDIQRSAKRYVDEIVLNNTTKNLSATLIHTDTNIRHWDLEANTATSAREGNMIYKLSHFPLLPGNVEALRTYMKRLFHYFHEERSLCPSCGKSTKPSSPGWKETYICTDDHEVWVKSTCNHCVDEPRVQLLKYATENYNEQVEQQWNVHCPKCQKEFKGRKVKLDIFGNRLITANEIYHE